MVENIPNKLKLLQLKYQMMIFNFVAISIGVSTVFILSYRSISPPTPEIERLTWQIALVLEPIGFLLFIVFIIRFERPIRHYLDLTYQQAPIPPELEMKARQRLLNEPFFLIGLDFFWWMIAAALYPISYYQYSAGEMIIGRALLQNILIGLVTTTAAFFILEYVLQKLMVPYFFPTGGLYMTPKTLRIRIRNRLAALLLACNLVPFLAIFAILRGTYRIDLDPAKLVGVLRPAILSVVIFGVVVGIGLTLLVSGTITRPLNEIIRVLKRVRDGHFDRKVRVTSNDEIGYTGDVINEMTEGLKERNRMRSSLELAKEVQQHFLPDSDPLIPGLDIAGRSIYCERTGGDYFDYLDFGTPQAGRIGIAVGDVSGHGIPSALLMASVRASLRQRALLPGSLADIISAVNHHMAQDVQESGRFMTLFYSEIDTHRRTIRWIRAGHDPAMFYDPESDAFEELKGPGLALGVDGEWQYSQNQRSDLRKGHIILLCTDGIWEAHNPKGETFGKAALRDIIRQKASVSAQELLQAILQAVEQFRAGISPEDDVTLVVVKVSSTLEFN
jgi:sigma-B regulation protein RsbU (phosphoserine phosphatase)